MDDTKDNSPAAAQDSDDLIAELARLVAQDARNTSSRSDAYKREEPRLELEPAAVEPQQNDFYEAEQSFGVPGERDVSPEFEEPQAGEGDPGPEFDFGIGGEPAAEMADVDPIADLIADAEVEAYDRDFAGEADWVEDDPQPFPPEDIALPDEGQGYERIDEFTFAAPEQPAPAESRNDRDPLHEIESLIGEAARVDLGDSGMSGRRVRSSYLDGTQTDAAVDAAESAILAAAAATGAPVYRAEPEPAPEPEFAPEETPYIEEPAPAAFHPDPLFAAEPAAGNAAPRPEAEEYGPDDEEEAAYERPRRRLNGFVLPVAAGVVIVALIGGIYFAFFSGPGDPGEAPVLTADAEPFKQEATPTTVETAASESVVFNEIEGNTTPPETEALVSRDQTRGESGAEVTGVLAPEEGESELVNRPVRTVTVRPDGTIVQAEDSVAGSNVLPVDRPEVPAVPNSTLTADPIGEAIAQAMAGETASPLVSEAEQVAGLDEAAAPVAEAAAENAGVGVPANDDATAPRPIPRPAGLTAPTQTQAVTPTVAPAVPATQTAAIATPVPTQTQPAAAAGSTPGAWVQLASQRSEDVARAGVADLQSRYGALFSGAELEVSQVDLGERGIYYRVRLPQPSLADANAVCGAIQGQGGDCFVMDN